jgi:hypothetical protein
MSLARFFFLVMLGGVAGFGAGFIGVGGGVLLFPLLLYLPPSLGLEAIDAKTAAALVSSEVFFAGIIGGAAHWRKGRVHRQLTLIGAIASAVGAFIGGVGSKWVSGWLLLLLFGIITILAGLVMFLPGPPPEKEAENIDTVEVPTIPLSVISCGVGAVVGLLGAGNFLFVPLFIYVLKIPTRITIGSSLAIYALNSFAGFFGKLITGQIPLLPTIAVIIGTSVGVFLGEKIHSRVSPQVLRLVFSVVIAAVALRVWITILFSEE